ncbi:AsmA-like C-terminal region-containing protein [Roseiconus lacunae]|uniref:AsmA-like C-terminal region-containing protein n=1 Tax=Roseiconus lacunae TaxID=2605694 RepID=A0ABT7PIA4_9BACT|nr:AsmA-like C-terminal region-containing protein [Roseiconus lacunae]MDM4015916.1 AsmA-like C-terminal region-containing protein [Roseiconus lacunae]
MLLTVAARNSIVRFVAEHGASYALGTRVEIASVEINWHRWTVTGLSIEEPSVAGEYQVTVDRVSVVPSFGRGVREGVWVELVVIDQPKGHLRFDRDGKLLSVFPESESSESAAIGTIPVHNVIVKEASLAIHQIGKQTLVVDQVDLFVRCADRIQARCRIGRLFGGELAAGGDFDAKDFSGQSWVDLTGIRLETQTLAKLPFVPESINAEPSYANVDLKVHSLHPPLEADLLDQQVKCVLRITDVTTERFGVLCDEALLESKFVDRMARAKLTANPFGSRFSIRSEADWKAINPRATVDLRMEPFGLGDAANEMAQVLATDFPALAKIPKLGSVVEAVAHASVEMVGRQLKFSGQSTIESSNNQIASIKLPSISFNSEVHGTAPFDDVAALDGAMKGGVNIAAFELNELAVGVGMPEVSGAVSGGLDFEIPLQTVTRIETLVAKAGVHLAKVSAFDFALDETSIRCHLDQGIATIHSDPISIRDPEAELVAQLRPAAQVALVGEAKLATELYCLVQPTESVIRRFGLESLDPRGRLETHVLARCPLEHVARASDWNVTAGIQSTEVRLVGEKLSDIAWEIEISRGAVTAPPVNLRWRTSNASLSIDGDIGDDVRVEGTFAVDSILLQEVSAIVSRFSQTPLPLSGSAAIDGTFELHASPGKGTFTAIAAGEAKLADATYARSDIGDARLSWSLTPEGLSLETGSDDFLGGNFRITADMNQLDWTTTQVQGKFSEIDVPALVAISGQTLASTGVLQGGFSVTSLASLEELTGQAWVETKQVSIEQIPLQLDRATVTLSEQAVLAEVDGSVLYGRFTGSMSTRLDQLIEFASQPTMVIEQAPVVGRVKLVGLALDQVASTFRLSRELRRVGGSVSGECVRDASSLDGRHLCRVSGSLENLRYQGVGLSQICSLDAVIHRDRIELNRLQGRFADGRINGTGMLTIGAVPSGYFDCVVSRVNLRRAASAVGVNDISGSATLRMRSRIGPVITGHADVQLDHLVAAGVGVRQATFPIDWSFRPTSTTARWQCRAGRLSVGGGTVRIATEGRYTRSLDMVTSVQVQRVDLSKLMQRGSIGSGIIDGEVSLRAKHARSINDFVGTYDFEMSNIEALQFPVLDQLPRMVSLSAPTPGKGQDGAIAYGRIGGGIVHIEEVAVYQSNVQVMVTGKANFNQKLDLDVVASTSSDSPTDQLVSLLDSPLMLAAPAPVALIVKANELLKDRVVNVHVGGTAGRPVLRLQTGKQLGQNAVKFFLANSFGSTVTGLAELRSKQQRR